MRKELLVASLVSLVILAAYYSSNESKVDAFGEWKEKFGVSWAPEEEAYRRLIFEKNLLSIEKHNADSTQTYKMGVNQFTIYTTEEFASRFLIPMATNKVSQVDETMATIGDVDWTTQGKVSPVKNQGTCGSCWAFSAVGALQSFFRIKGQTHSFSQQQLVDCSGPQGNHGCSGGWPANALNYVKTYGITNSSAYPYTGKDQACKTQGGAYKIAGHGTHTGCSALSSGINALPIAVAVDATNWGPYTVGVFNNCQANINHAVLLVGVVGGSWKIKNSWGTTWGEKGYIRLAGGNTCGVCVHAGAYPK